MFVHHTRIDCIAVGLFLFINSKSSLFRHEARDHNAKICISLSRFHVTIGQYLCQSYRDGLVVATNGSGVEKTWGKKRLNLLSETLQRNASIQPYY